MSGSKRKPGFLTANRNYWDEAAELIKAAAPDGQTEDGAYAMWNRMAVTMANRDTGKIGEYSVVDFAEFFGKNRRTIKARLDLLESVGLIERRGRYWFIPCMGCLEGLSHEGEEVEPSVSPSCPTRVQAVSSSCADDVHSLHTPPAETAPRPKTQDTRKKTTQVEGNGLRPDEPVETSRVRSDAPAPVPSSSNGQPREDVTEAVRLTAGRVGVDPEKALKNGQILDDVATWLDEIGSPAQLVDAASWAPLPNFPNVKALASRVRGALTKARADPAGGASAPYAYLGVAEGDSVPRCDVNVNGFGSCGLPASGFDDEGRPRCDVHLNRNRWEETA